MNNNQQRVMKKVLVLICVFISINAFAQQDIQVTHNMFNRYMVNPGFAGSEDKMTATLLYRNQWVGFEGAPTSQNFNFTAPSYKLAGGVGINVISDQIGDGFSHQTATVSYAFQARMSKESTLGIGLSVGVTNIGFDYDVWLAPDGGGGQNDPSIPDADASATIPDIGFGLYFTKKSFYLGVSATRLFEFTAEFPGGDAADYTPVRHIYLSTGFEYDLNRYLTLQPSVFAKTDDTQAQFDFGMNLRYDDVIWGGLAYRVDDAISFLAGYQISDDFLLGYSYDLTTSDLRTEQSGSHEVILKYSFNVSAPSKRNTRYRNIRFL